MEVKWKIAIFLAHLSALCSGSEASDYLPGSDWVYFKNALGGFLKLHTEPADWHSARVKCHMEGAFLASPWFLEFTKVIKEIQADRSELEKVYSGVHKTFVEGALTFVEGKMVISTYPSDLMDIELCEVFQADGSTGEVHCKEKLPFICYRPDTGDNDFTGLLSPTPIPAEYFNAPTSNPKTQFSTEPALSQTLANDCGEENLGYEFAEQTGHCYKFHSEAVMTWHDAKEACEEEGGYLAIVNSVAEVQVLKELFAKYPHEKIHGAMYSDTAAIGFQKDGDDWLTIDGKTLHEAGYESWRPEAPSYYATLGFICRDGLLYGYAVDIRFLPFICEKPATMKTYNSIPDQKPTEASEESETTEPINYDSDLSYDSYEMKTTPEAETTTHTSIDAGAPLTLMKGYNCGGQGYEFAEQTGHCYKFHSEAVMTWHDAKEACEEEGGYLAIVNSVGEVQVLKELFAKYPHEKIHGAMYADTAAIGFKKDGHDWLTIDGKTLQEAGYESWRPEAPSYYATLGFICRDGLLYGYSGDIRFLPFICEKPATMKTYNSIPDQKPTEASEESETTEPINYDSDLSYDSYEMKTTPEAETTTHTSIDDGAPLTLMKGYNCGGQGYEYSMITNHCYKFHAQAVHTWYDAKAACEQEGGYLAIINSDLEAQVLKKLFERYPAEKMQGVPYTDTAAIGYLRDEFDDWVTIDGDELEVAGYEAWRPDAPHPWAKLGFLYRDGLLYGYVPVIRDVPYICEKPRVLSLRTEQEQSTTENEPEQITEQENYTSTTETDQEADVEPKLDLSLIETSNCSAGYGFSKQTGHCYRFYAQAVHTWYHAKRACEEDGAYLAIINSNVEAQVLRTLFEQYPADKIFGTQYTDTAAIGYYKDRNSTWVTVHGETLEEAGYAIWTPNGPHPWAQLGFIYRDGRLSAFVEAIRDEPYICEKEPSEQEYSSSTEAQTTKSNYDELTVEPNYDEYTFEPNYYDDPHYDEILEQWKQIVNQYNDEKVTVETKHIELETEKPSDQETTSSYKKTSEQALKRTNYCEGRGYEFFEQTGRCYKFHTQSTKNMLTAIITCLEEKTEIIVINSDVETLVVKTLLENNPLDTMADYFLIPRNKDGRRITIDGGGLEEDDYGTWSDQETIYGSFDRYGRLPDPIDQNDYVVPFICEKGPIEQSSTTTKTEFAHITEEEKLSEVTEKEIEPTTEEKLEETTIQSIDRSIKDNTIFDKLKTIFDLEESIEDTVTYSTEDEQIEKFKTIFGLEESIEDTVTYSTEDELPKTTEKEFEQTTQDRFLKTTQNEFSQITSKDELQTTEDGLPQPTERVIEQTSQDSKQKNEVEDAYYQYITDSMYRQTKNNPRFHFDEFKINNDDDMNEFT